MNKNAASSDVKTLDKNKTLSKEKVPMYVEDLRRYGARLIRPNLMNHAIKKIFDECRISAAPVDVKSIANQMGLNVHYVAFKDAEIKGIIWDTFTTTYFSPDFGDKRGILVSLDDTWESQQFTIAFAIGQFIMYCRDSRDFCAVRYSKYKNVSDVQKKHSDNADFFATNLLLPSNLIITYAMNNKGRGRVDLISRICVMFGVDVETVNKRFNELGLEI